MSRASSGATSSSWFARSTTTPDQPKPTVAFVTPAGNNLGWINEGGKYQGPSDVSTAFWNRDKMGQYVSHTDPTLINEVRARHPDWTMIFVSACSHDASNGEGQNPDFIRVGWLALASALKWVHARTPITELYANGASAGGSAAFFIARDLEHVLDDVDVRGVVFDSQGQQPRSFAALFEDGNRRVVTTGDGDATTEVSCTLSWAPALTGLERTGLLRDASDDIADGLLDAPIFHVWNRRDRQFCYDAAYSDEHLHGPIADAIVAHNPGDRSMNREVCISRASDTSLDGDAVLCGKHGTLYECQDGCTDELADPAGPTLVESVADWIDALHDDWTGAETEPTAR